jgi:hypothetical protein
MAQEIKAHPRAVPTIQSSTAIIAATISGVDVGGSVVRQHEIGDGVGREPFAAGAVYSLFIRATYPKLSRGDRAMGDDHRRLNSNKRSGKDRRSGVDTRPDAEKKSMGERRSGRDRRSGTDRRSTNAKPDVR